MVLRVHVIIDARDTALSPCPLYLPEAPTCHQQPGPYFLHPLFCATCWGAEVTVSFNGGATKASLTGHLHA